MREELGQLKQSVEAVTTATPNSLVERILAYASRPMTELNKFEALEMLETLQNKAADVKYHKMNYYRLVYQTTREKVDSPKDHFKNLVMCLLGDKDDEKVLDTVTKIEKSHRKASHKGVNKGLKEARAPRLFNMRCYVCIRRGHFRGSCPERGAKSGK